jgi:hypothetical protein
LDPVILRAPIVWLASDQAEGVHNERIVAAVFGRRLARHLGWRTA